MVQTHSHHGRVLSESPLHSVSQIHKLHFQILSLLKMWKIANFSSFKKMYLFIHLCVCVYKCTSVSVSVHTSKTEGSLKELFFSSHYVGPLIKLRMSALVTTAFVHWFFFSLMETPFVFNVQKQILPLRISFIQGSGPCIIWMTKIPWICFQTPNSNWSL